MWKDKKREAFTFTLHSLAEDPFEQAFAELADGGACVRVDDEGVWHLDPPQNHLLHPDWPAAPGGDALPCLLMGALLREHSPHRTSPSARSHTHSFI